MSLSRSIIFSLSFLLPFWVLAQSGMLDSQTTLADLNLLIAQYETRIKQLQSENAVLKYEMAKAGIQIPLWNLSWATIPLPTSIATGTTSPAGGAPVDLVSANISLSGITTQYGKDVAGFISRINREWAGIKAAYALPTNARLAGYEFVQTGWLDHVFADIVVGTGTTGIYDIKILYQYEKSEYKRKLIGVFDYNPSVLRYTTRSGTNPFGGISRNFVRDPYYAGVIQIPSTALPSVASGSVSPAPVSTSGSTLPTSGSASSSEITKAYNEKRYLSTISLSNAYLASNPATQEILNIRYRTYFIIGKYTESLAELAKMETLGTLDKQTACNAQVIATYSKNQTLVDKYTAICKK
jgi:hypothetical protein